MLPAREAAMPPNPDPRRRALLGALALWPLSMSVPPAWAQAAADGAGLVAPNVCLLTPETTAGPFYFDPALVREDISEGSPGAPLQLVLQVVDADCRAQPGARVDVLALDAAGQLLRLSGPGQRPGARHKGRELPARHPVRRPRRDRALSLGLAGLVPRADPARPLLGVPRRRRTVLTSQLFFPDGASEVVFLTPPYRERAAAQDTDNARDGIARRAGPATFARVARAGAGWRAELVVGVDPAA